MATSSPGPRSPPSPHLPATGLPAGECDGQPIGVPLIGPYMEDLTTIRAAELLSSAAGEGN